MKILSTGFIARKLEQSETQTRRDLDTLNVPRDVNGRRMPTEKHLRELQRRKLVTG